MRLDRLILDYVPIEKIKANTTDSDGSEFEQRVIDSVKAEGFYNPITTDVRERSYRWNPKIHYVSLGNHRYWLAKKANFTHLWCIVKVWNAQLDGGLVAENMKIVDMICVIKVPTKSPPWEIRDLKVVDMAPDRVVKGRVYQASPDGNFTGRMLIEPGEKVNPETPIILCMKSELTSLLE